VTASANLHRVADDIRELPAAAMARLTDEARRIVDGAAPWPSMRGKKRAGLPVTMARSQRVRTTGDGATFRVQGTVPGWLWANSGTRGHRIPRRHSGAEHRLTVVHPGMRGRHAWARVVSQLRTTVPKIVADEMRRVVS
jgi:hypothetical protein